MNDVRSVWTLDEERQLSELKERKDRIYAAHDVALYNEIAMIFEPTESQLGAFKARARMLREALKPYDL